MARRQNSSETIREEAVNTILAQMIRGYGVVSARAERRSREGTPDVRVELKTGDTVLLECKWEGSESSLDEQLDERLADFPESLCLIGVLYPDRLRRTANIEDALETSKDIRWWLHGSRGQPLPDRRVRIGSVSDLAEHLRALALELEGLDQVVAATLAVGYGIDQAAQVLDKHARLSRRVADIIAKTDRENDREAALRIGCLVLFNALAFQDRLAEINGDVPTVSESWEGGVRTLSNDWREVCNEIDYIPVFELAADILEILRYAPEDTHSSVMSPLIGAMERTRRLEGHDLSGRLFHTLLTDAKFTGAYYTSVPAATLLTRLVFHDWPSHVDWSNHEFPSSFSVADLACGTGTLLMAVASEVERRHTTAGGQNAAELHKAMVEQALHGYDVQLSAIHFAATSLAMLNPHIEFDRMNLWVMLLGDQGSNVSLGSLDFLGEDEVPVQYALTPEDRNLGARRVSGRGSRGARQGVTAKLPQLDLVIMNPPFTRPQMLFGSLSTSERGRIQKELNRRLKSRKGSAIAGMGAAFVAAASPKLRPGAGRMALVLPATVCTGQAWEQTRSLIEENFTLDTVITSHDPLRWNFSDSTDLSESLLIATRRKDGSSLKGRRTTFVNLWENPDGVLDAHRVAQAITATTPARIERTGTALLEVDGRHVGEVVSLPTSRIVGKKWSGMQFARADVIRSALRLLEDGEVWVAGGRGTTEVSLCPLGELGRIGPDRRRLIDGFDETASVTAYPMVKGHDTSQRKSMTCSPDFYLSPLATPRGGQKSGYGERLWTQASQLLIAERLWLESNRVVAMRSDRRVLSNTWWEVRVGSVTIEKTLAVWLNSSLGLLTIMAQRTSTRGGWVAMKKADLRELPILDTRCLTRSQLRRLSKLFDDMAEDEFESLPGMADCPARRRLDDGLSKILDLPDLDNLRRLLASEPVVSNRRL